MEASYANIWRQEHFDFLTYIISSTVALPATAFFLFAAVRGIFFILGSVHHAMVKALVMLITLIATFLITHYYFALDLSLSQLHRNGLVDSPTLYHLHATSSHTLCLLLGVGTTQWVHSHKNLSSVSKTFFNIIMSSLFFIGALTWFVFLFLSYFRSNNNARYFFFFQNASALFLGISISNVTPAQACSSALSHWLSFMVGKSMLMEYYNRNFHKSKMESAMLHYYAACGISLACLPHAWKVLQHFMGIYSINPLMSPCLWSFLSIFLFRYVSTRRLEYYAIIIFSIASISLYAEQIRDHQSSSIKSTPELYEFVLKTFENSALVKTMALLAFIIFILSLIVECFILVIFEKRADPKVQRKAAQSKEARRKRFGKFPPAYPNGWYRLFNSEDIAVGESRYINTCGTDFAVFRGENGEVGILDAFCPHLGANLGIASKVIGNHIQCPFHGWEFDNLGICQKIPYSPNVPKVAKTRSWPAIEFADMICVFFHCDGEEPDYIPFQLPEIDKCVMSRYHIWEMDLDMHIQDFAENAADYAHFDFVHDDLDIPVGKGLFFVTHNVLWHKGTPDDPSLDAFSYFTDDTRIHCSWFPSFPFPQYVKAMVLFSGPGLVYFRFTTPLGDILLVKTFQPLGPLKMNCQDRVYADKLLPSLFVRFVAAQALHAFMDDVIIWENKSYSFKPMVVKGDGPMGKVRRWFSQFYTENSNQTSLEW